MISFHEYLTEMVVGGMLTLFGFMVRSYVNTLSKQLAVMVTKFESIQTGLHQHEIANARDLAKISAEITNIYKRMDRP